MAVSDGSEPESASFEEILGRLREVVERLESGELPLEESLRVFEEGIRLSRLGESRLEAAERRVEELLADGSIRPLPSALPEADPDE